MYGGNLDEFRPSMTRKESRKLSELRNQKKRKPTDDLVLDIDSKSTFIECEDSESRLSSSLGSSLGGDSSLAGSGE